MSSDLIIDLADASIVTAIALLCKALKKNPVLGVLPSAIHKIHKPHEPLPSNTLSSSSFRPHILACDYIKLWSAGQSDSFHATLLSSLLVNAASLLLNVMLLSIKSKTSENYNAGLLHFHQFCNSNFIPENQCLPASEYLLAAFIASWAGKVAENTADN
ncbi:hypothetical protein F4604DRAFT_1926047 [Suillus subluteus]|nr:hypothetical protein F4604DRAFT_1926047 [Suillus subluteus]